MDLNSDNKITENNILDEEIIDINLEAVVKLEIPEVKTEIFDFDTPVLPSVIGEKRKSNEIEEINNKKFKKEFVVFEESDDKNSQIENGETEIVIRINGQNQNAANLHLEKFEPTSDFLTKNQEVELVAKCRQLKAKKVRGFYHQGTKWLYEKYFPVAFYNHNKNKDWDKCYLSKHKVRYTLYTFCGQFCL